MAMSVLSDRKLLEEALSKTGTMSACLEYLGLRPAGGNFRTLRFYCEQYGLEVPDGYANRRPPPRRVANSDLFRKGGSYNRANVRRRIIEDGLIPYRCASCGQDPEWNGAPLSLHLDHINGEAKDHRLENLRFLCPNCHSQTKTYAGKATAKPKKPADPAWRSRPRPHTRKVERPSKEELAHLVETMSFLAIGRLFGVSDNAVRKWARAYNLLPR